MEITAIAKNVRMSPRKVRLVADAVRGLPATVAIDKLSFLVKAAAGPMLKAIKSAMANGTNNLKLKAEDLKIKNVLVDEGIKMKRRDTSHGARFGGGIIQKRSCHIKVVLTDNQDQRSLRPRSGRAKIKDQNYGK